LTLSTAETLSLSDRVRDAFIAAAPGPSEVTDAAAQALYGQLFRALEGADDPAEPAGEAAQGLVAATKKCPAPTWHLARGATLGAIHAAVGRGLDPAPLIRSVTNQLMLAADKVGGDFGAAAQGAVEGCAMAADELALDPGALASVAATAALETSKDLAEGSHEKVHHLVTRDIGSFTITVPRSLSL
jgi:hypothetical protein